MSLQYKGWSIIKIGAKHKLETWICASNSNKSHFLQKKGFVFEVFIRLILKIGSPCRYLIQHFNLSWRWSSHIAAPFPTRLKTSAIWWVSAHCLPVTKQETEVWIFHENISATVHNFETKKLLLYTTCVFFSWINVIPVHRQSKSLGFSVILFKNIHKILIYMAFNVLLHFARKLFSDKQSVI